MLVVNTVSPGVVRYFTDGRHPGRWSRSAGRLLGLEGPVDPRELRRLLQGRDPVSGRYLPETRPHRRRAGWDLIFGAPKSVSLLAASAEDAGGTVAEAHVAAVDGVMGQVEGRLLLRRERDGAPLPADGLLSASFDHVTNAANEPHLHTHVLVANLGRAGDAWGAVQDGEWYVGRSGLAALYQLELRWQLAQRGWQLDWRLRPDGMADLADVPRAAVRAASTQSHLATTAGRYAARALAAPQPWAERVAKATGAAISFHPRESTVGPSLEDPLLERTVSVRLTARRSDFRRSDVVVALAACHAGGATASEATEWAERFCTGNHRVRSPTSGGRWTTEAARRADDELLMGLRARAATVGVVPVEGEVDERRFRDRLPADAVPHAVALTSTDSAIHFLGAQPGRSSLLAQAEVIGACREVWEASGLKVAVSSPSADGALRWSVLAGLEPHRAGDRADVLIVDRTDRRTTSELIRLTAGRAAKLVLVEGGTLPRLTNPASHGLMELADELGRRYLPPHTGWEPALREGPGNGESGRPGRPVGRSAAESLLAAWMAHPERPLMVGLGLEETRGLNRAALDVRPDRPPGAGEGPVAGDRVVVMKARPGLPVYGTFGTVVDGASVRGRVRSPTGPVSIAWDSGEVTVALDRRTLAGVGFGYAVTPYLASRTTGPLMVLGPASALGRGRDRVVRDVGIRGPGRERGRSAGL